LVVFAFVSPDIKLPSFQKSSYGEFMTKCALTPKQAAMVIVAKSLKDAQSLEWDEIEAVVGSVTESKAEAIQEFVVEITDKLLETRFNPYIEKYCR
jgi:hypothetical protein